jgi:hypothetical protein
VICGHSKSWIWAYNDQFILSIVKQLLDLERYLFFLCVLFRKCQPAARLEPYALENASLQLGLNHTLENASLQLGLSCTSENASLSSLTRKMPTIEVSQRSITGQKLFFLHAALFELLPEEDMKAHSENN